MTLTRLQFCWGVSLGLFLTFSQLACGGSEPAVASPAAHQPVRAASRTLVIIFDPTILAKDEQISLDALLAQLSQRIEVAEGMRVLVWSVSEGMMQRPAPHDNHLFKFNPYSKDDGVHKKEVVQWFKTSLAPVLRASWNAAHNLENSPIAATCLVTALYCLSSHLKGVGSHETVDVLVISDLLEVCKDWSQDQPTVNMEERLRKGFDLEKDLPVTTEAEKHISLTRVARLVVAHVPNLYVKTPIQRERVQTVWRKAFDRLKVTTPVEFSDEIPLLTWK